MDGQRGPGRPRSEETRRALLRAALDELGTHGYSGSTVAGIAARAGASKQTVYRWWSGKAEVVLEALLGVAEAVAAVPDTGTLAEDLTAFITASFRGLPDWRPVLTGLMAETVLDPAFAAAFREQFLFRRRAVLRAVLERARDRGELRRHADSIDLLVDIVFGVLWYRLLLEHAPLDPTVSRQLSAIILDAVC